MHLFPRSVKDKRLGTSVVDKTFGSAGGTSSSARPVDTSIPANTQDFTPDPNRPVYLTTFNRRNPLKRNTRELGRGNKPQEDNDEQRKRDEDREAVQSCAPYTESFNQLLRNVPKRTRNVVQLVMDRMRSEQIPMDATTYNLLLEKVVDLRDDVAFRLYDEFREESQKEDASVRPDLHTFQLLMRACERNGWYEKAFHLYSQMKELLGIYPDVSMYNTLIGFCAAMHDEAQASYIVEEMKDRGQEPDVHTYNCLMNVFHNAPYEVTLQTFEDMVRRRIKPNLRSFNTLMKACLRMWDYDRAFQYFEELKKEGLVPDVVTYNILLMMCRERLDFVFGTGSYTHLRRSREQREVGMRAVAELSMSLLAEMEDLEILPNTFTYNALLAVLGKCDDFRVMDVFAHMKSDNRWDHVVAAGAQSDGEEGDPQSWTAQNLDTFRGTAGGASPSMGATATSAAPQTSLPHSIITEEPDASIAGRGVAVNLETYKCMIEAALRMKLPKMAFIFFKEMKERDMAPTKDIFILMLRVCCVEGQRHEATVLFEESRSLGMVDVDLYNGKMDVLANAKDEELFNAFDALRHDRDRLSLKPNDDSFNVVLSGCFRMKQVDRALGLYEEMCAPDSPTPPNTSTYGLLIDIASLVKDTKMAANFILDMKRRRVPVTTTTYCRLLNCYVEADDQGVVMLFEDMLRHGPPPSLEAYLIMLKYHQIKLNPAIVQMFDDMKVGPIEPDLECYNVMLEYCAAINNHQKSFKYFEELKTRGMSADINTYNALIGVFAPTGSDFVYKVFEEMQELKIAPNHVTFSILMKHKAGRHCLTVATDQKLIYMEPGGGVPHLKH